MSVDLVASDGKVIFVTHGVKADIDSGFLMDVFRSKSSNISNFMGNNELGYHVVIAVPIIRQGSARYVMAAFLDKGWFNSAFSRSLMPHGWIAGLVDRSGLIVARSFHFDETQGMSIHPEVQAVYRKTDSGTVNSHTMEGIPCVIAFSGAPHSGYKAMVVVPDDDFSAPLYMAITRMITAASIFFVLALLQLPTPRDTRSGSACGVLCAKQDREAGNESRKARSPVIHDGE